MPGFDASAAVEPLHCILKPFADFEGNIPEPSTVQVQEFYNAQREEMHRAAETERKRREAAGADDDGSDAETDDSKPVPFVKGPTPAEVKKDTRRAAEMYSAVCSGTPTAAQIEQLPHRIFAKFAEWVNQDVINPEAATGAGENQA